MRLVNGLPPSNASIYRGYPRDADVRTRVRSTTVIVMLPGDKIPLRNVTHDAVVVVPGIMGSQLTDGASGRVLWGLRDLKWWARAWARNDGMDELALTPQELEQLHSGTYSTPSARVRATGLLECAVALPVLGGVEPYGKLVRQLQTIVAHPAALLTFAYDWRLPVRFNTGELAKAIRAHLDNWRKNPASHGGSGAPKADGPAQLVIVAHSMGGLVARGLSLIPGATDDVRAIVTLGTPFYGSVKAAVLLNRGDGSPIPLPNQHLAAAAATMPGVYDLLPTYRCLLTDDTTRGVQRSPGLDDVVRLIPSDVTALGADANLADKSFSWHDQLAQAPITGHRAFVGTHQPTLQSMRLEAGVVRADERYFRWSSDYLQRDQYGQPETIDEGGDGTVFRYAATPQGFTAIETAQQHGALAKSTEMLRNISNAITNRGGLGIKLGAGELGLRIPDIVHPGISFDVVVTGADDPAAVECVVERPIGEWKAERVAGPTMSRRRDGGEGLTANTRIPEPGLYRILVKTGGSDPVSQLVLCLPD